MQQGQSQKSHKRKSILLGVILAILVFAAAALAWGLLANGSRDDQDSASSNPPLFTSGGFANEDLDNIERKLLGSISEVPATTIPGSANTNPPAIQPACYFGDFGGFTANRWGLQADEISAFTSIPASADQSAAGLSAAGLSAAGLSATDQVLQFNSSGSNSAANAGGNFGAIAISRNYLQGNFSYSLKLAEMQAPQTASGLSVFRLSILRKPNDTVNLNIYKTAGGEVYATLSEFLADTNSLLSFNSKAEITYEKVKLDLPSDSDVTLKLIREDNRVIASVINSGSEVQIGQILNQPRTNIYLAASFSVLGEDSQLKAVVKSPQLEGCFAGATTPSEIPAPLTGSFPDGD